MKEYDEENVVHRGSVLFIPLMSNGWPRVFAARGAGFTVLSFGVDEHHWTIYLLAPTPLAEGYTDRLQENSPEYCKSYYTRFCTVDCEDTT